MRKNHFVFLLLAGMTWIVFWRVYSFEFVNLDDPKYVAQNEHVLAGLSWDNVVWAFTTTYFSNWHPFTWLSYLLDAQLFGINSGWFHVTNLLLHTGNVLLLFALLRRMTGAVWKSAFAAALFAIHPLHVESVAWVSERKDLLSTFFGLVAVAAYVRYASRGTWNWYLLAFFSFAASLLAKQMLVTLPFLLLLLDYWPLGRVLRATPSPPAGDAAPTAASYLAAHPVETSAGEQFSAHPLSRLVLEKVPFLVLSMVACVVIYTTQQQSGAGSMLELPIGIRLQNGVLAYAIYLRKTVWPDDLAVFYPHPGEGISQTSVAAAAGFLVLVTVVAIQQWRHRPYLLIGWLWYLGTLVPVIGIVQVGTQQMADRYTYVPLIGIFVAASWLVPSVVPPGRRRVYLLAGSAVAVLLALSVTASHQTKHWQDSVTLLQHALAVARPSALVHTNLGAAWDELRQFDKAAEQYRAAIRVDPEYVGARNNLGAMLTERGRLDEAIEHLRQALRTDPEHANAHFNMANALSKQGQIDEATFHYQESLRIDPENPKPYNNLGALLQDLGRFDEAVQQYRTALSLDPTDARARYNLGDALSELDQFEEALFHLKRAVQLAPADDNIRSRLASVHVSAGARHAERERLLEAKEHFLRAIELTPASWRAHYNLAVVLSMTGELEAAAVEYTKTLTLKPDSPEAHNSFGKLLLRLDRREQAIKRFRKALRLRPDFPEAQQNLLKADAE
jgi:tetratricopeptide (TPR) repeat protein